MLQDLDFLAARIGQLVELTKQLQAEHAALGARAEQAEQARNQLQKQLTRQENEFNDVAARAQWHEAEIAQIRAAAQTELDALRTQLQSQSAEQLQQAHAAQERLESELNQQRTAYKEILEQLEQSRTEANRLRQAAADARERIDALLERLPGAPQE
jgi:chromosome segregation ATPase